MRLMIDCDIHNVPASVQVLFPYLSDHWKEYMTQSAFRGPTDSAYPKNAPTSARPESRPPAGGPPGSDLSLVQQQVLDAWGMEYGILTCAYAVDGIIIQTPPRRSPARSTIGRSPSGLTRSHGCARRSSFQAS